MNFSALIFSHSITPRLQYVVDFLSQYFGFPFKLISDEEKYINEIMAEIGDEKQSNRFNRAMSLLSKDSLKHNKGVAFEITQSYFLSYLKKATGKANQETFKNVVGHYNNLQHFREKYKNICIPTLASLLSHTDYQIKV